MIRCFFKAISREFSILRSCKFIQFTIFILPIIFILMVISTFSAGTPENLPIAIVDLDHSKLSRSMIREIDDAKSTKVEYLLQNSNDGKILLSGGDIYALIVIPEHFESDVSKRKSPQVVYYYNNQMILTGGIVSKDIATVLQNLSSKLSINLRMKAGMPKHVAFNNTNIVRYDEKVKGNPYLNYSYFLTYVLIAHIFQVFITLTTVWTFAREFKKGITLEWYRLNDSNIVLAVSSKVFTYFIVFYSYMALCYYLYVIFFPAPFNGCVSFVALGLLLFVLAYMMMGLFFVAITSNFRKAISFGAIYTSLGFSFSGMTYPSMALTDFADGYSHILPIRPFTNLIINQALRGVQPEYNTQYLWWLSIYIVIGIVSIPLLKKHVLDKNLCYQL